MPCKIIQLRPNSTRLLDISSPLSVFCASDNGYEEMNEFIRSCIREINETSEQNQRNKLLLDIEESVTPPNKVDSAELEMRKMPDSVSAELNKLDAVLKTIERANTAGGRKELEYMEGLTEQLKEFIRVCGECENERKEKGINKAKELFYENETWQEGLLSCAREIVGWAQHISSVLAQGTEDADVVLASLKQFKSYCSQLISAARVSMDGQSSNLAELEAMLPRVIASVQRLSKCITESAQKGEATVNKTEDGVKAKTEILESEIKISKLQRELQSEQSRLYRLRQTEYK